MTRIEMTEAIILSKNKANLSWEDIASKVGLGSVFLTSACLGMNSLKEEYAKKLCEVLDLSSEVEKALKDFPHKSWEKSIPTDPVIYRFYEIVGVYGDTIKEIIGEKFGDGIMSAIDFNMDIQRESNPNGDRVNVVLSGKFLPYKTY